MTVLPVTATAASSTPSRRRLARETGWGGEVEGGELGGQPPVHLLGEGVVAVVGAQARLEVDHRHLLVERRQRRDHRGRGVALDHHGVGPVLAQDLRDPLQHALGDLVELLARLDHVEVVRRLDAEEGVDLVEHLAVLTGDGHDGLEVVGGGQRLHDRGHLDGLGTGAVDGHDASHGAASCPGAETEAPACLDRTVRCPGGGEVSPPRGGAPRRTRPRGGRAAARPRPAAGWPRRGRPRWCGRRPRGRWRCGTPARRTRGRAAARPRPTRVVRDRLEAAEQLAAAAREHRAHRDVVLGQHADPPLARARERVVEPHAASDADEDQGRLERHRDHRADGETDVVAVGDRGDHAHARGQAPHRVAQRTRGHQRVGSPRAGGVLVGRHPPRLSERGPGSTPHPR